MSQHDKDGNHADDLRLQLDELQARFDEQNGAFQACALKLQQVEELLSRRPGTGNAEVVGYVKPDDLRKLATHHHGFAVFISLLPRPEWIELTAPAADSAATEQGDDIDAALNKMMTAPVDPELLELAGQAIKASDARKGDPDAISAGIANFFAEPAERSDSAAEPVGITFEQAWAEYKKRGYHYGHDALEQVRFGWKIAMGTLAAAPASADVGELTEAQAFALATSAGRVDTLDFRIPGTSKTHKVQCAILEPADALKFVRSALQASSAALPKDEGGRFKVSVGMLHVKELTAAGQGYSFSLSADMAGFDTITPGSWDLYISRAALSASAEKDGAA